MSLRNAQKYLEAVCEKQRCIPFRVYKGCIGRTPQAKEFKMSQGRWPIKSCKIVLDLLKNAESNADFKNLDADNLTVSHIQVQRAQHGRRRTYRAHGRINPYQSSPCHIQMILQERTRMWRRLKRRRQLLSRSSQRSSSHRSVSRSVEQRPGHHVKQRPEKYVLIDCREVCTMSPV